MLPLRLMANLCAPLMVAGVLARRPHKVEPAAQRQRPFTGTTLAKRGGNCLKDWLNFEAWKTLPVK